MARHAKMVTLAARATPANRAHVLAVLALLFATMAMVARQIPATLNWAVYTIRKHQSTSNLRATSRDVVQERAKQEPAKAAVIQTRCANFPRK